jgi:hypothetical protein
METERNVRPREVLDELPRGVLRARGAEHDEARTAGDGCAGPVRPRQGRCRPCGLHGGGQAALEFADIPRARDVEREHAAAEIVPDVRRIGRRHDRRVAVAEHRCVERQRSPKSHTLEIAVLRAVTQQRVRLLQREGHERLDLVQRQQDRIPAGLRVRLQRSKRAYPVGPRCRHIADTRRFEQVAAIEEQARVDVPRHAIETSRDDVRIPDAAEEIARIDRRGRDRRVERLERAERDEFGDPRVAELADVGRRIARERGQQLFVRGGPRQLLDVDANAGMRALELGNERGDDLAFASHRPKADDGDIGGVAAASCNERRGHDERCGAAQRARDAGHCAVAVSQPPEKPARARPRRTYGFSRMTFQMRPLR